MAEFRPKNRGLERVLGTGALFATAYGNVGSSIYYALGLVAIFALGMTPVVFLIAGLIFICTAASYTEATTMYPEAGGSSSFARHAFNEFVSAVTAWGQMLNYIITVAISAFFLPHYLGIIWEPLLSSPGDIVVGIAVVAFLGALNVVGVQEAANLNIFLAIADFLTQVALVVLGFLLVFSPDTLVENVDFGVSPTVADFLVAIPVGMVAFTGIDTISNMAEEARDYGNTIPRAMRMVVVAVMTISLTLPAIALSAMPVEDGQTQLAVASDDGGYADNPVLGVVKNLELGGLEPAAELYVGLLAATILLVATNAGLIGLSRLSYSMGQYRQLPEKLRQLHPRFRTPYVAIVVFGLAACVAMLPGQAEFLGTVYAFGAMLSFTVAHASVIALRMKEPDRERPFRAPGDVRFRGTLIPLTAVLGGLGTGLAFTVVTVLNVETLIAGTVWLGLGTITYVAYRKRLGLTLTETRKIVLPEPVVEHEVEYESVMVAFEDGRYSSEAVATAGRLAARRRRGIHVVVTITVPSNSPIDAEMPEQEARAASVIDSARVKGGRRVTGHWEKVRPGQAGRRIVEEARDIRARAIVMELPPRRAGQSLFGKTIETVLSERPCRVIIESTRGATERSEAA
ncbi:MAG TPA: universal stress protein [Thermoleophilaceae bacterium]|nr:universal stress protein [Thermoleophilaceae bacterium]